MGSTFGQFTFDHRNRTLSREGKPVALGGRSAALLQVLLDADGQVVSKTNLMERAWAGMSVEEGNLTVQVAALRKALGRRSDNSEWIATVARVGYRLWVEDAQAPRETPSALPSLAVLPFHNLSDDVKQDYFADGIVDDLITALSRFKTFAVTSRNSSFVYKGRAVDVREIGRELGVRYVLEGSVRRSENRLRVTAQLVDATSAAHLWAQNYDGALEDVFDMQDRITESVVSIVEPMVKRAEIERTRLKPPTSLDAYDLYLEAMALVLTTEPGATLRAIELIERSLALDPNFPPATAIAAIACTSLYDRQMPGATEETRRRGLEYARMALALAGNDANIRVTGGISVIMLGGEYESGLAAVRQAVADNPNSVHVLGYAGVGALWASQVDEAEGYLLRAVRLNPNDHVSHWSLTRLAHIRVLQGRFEDALDWASRAYAASPTNAITHQMLVAANAFLGRLGEATRWAEALRRVSPETTFGSIRRGHQMMRDQRHIEVVIEGLRLGGMQEN
jgi:TolB-like protein/Tfp pilus assembly protein PilF